MHEQWQTLIPYYVAGSLSAQEAASLEHHLAECPACNAVFQEWSQIAGVVRTEAEAWAKPLPPLSQRVRESLATPDIRSNGYKAHPLPTAPNYRTSYQQPGERQRSNPKNGRTRSMMTLAAVLVLIMLFGGVLLLMNNRGSEEHFLATGPGDTPLTQVSVSPTWEETAFPTEAGTRDLGILSGTPTLMATPTNSIVVNPTADPSRCAVYSQSNNSVPVYRYPGTDQAVSTMLASNEFMYTWVQSGTGWYQVGRPGQGITGWIQASQVRLSGACSDLPVPTVTNTPPAITPTAPYEFGAGYNLITTEAVGPFAANTRVRVSHIWYNNPEWVYFVVAEDEVTSGEVLARYLAYDPDYIPGRPTPHALFAIEIGMGQYNLITLAQVGDMPSNTEVRVSHATYNGEEWIYRVVAQDEITFADVPEILLTYKPGVTPGPTPTSTAEMPPQIGYFNADREVALRGEPIVLEWAVYSVEMAVVEMQDDTAVQALYDDLPTSGTLTVPISESYAGDTVRFTLSAANAGASGYDPLAQTSIEIPVVDEASCEPPFYNQDSDRQICPIQMEQTTIEAAIETFENGYMLWRGDIDQIIVLRNDGSYWYYSQTDYADLLDNPVTDSPPEGLYKPVSGFGRVWGNYLKVRDQLGWALEPERGYTMTVQKTDSAAISYYYLTFPEGGLVVRINNNYTWSFYTP